MEMYIRLALKLRRPLDEVMSWSPEVLATVENWLEEQYYAEKDAAKGK